MICNDKKLVQFFINLGQISAVKLVQFRLVQFYKNCTNLVQFLRNCTNLVQFLKIFLITLY